MRMLKREEEAPVELAKPASKRVRPQLSPQQIALFGSFTKSNGYSLADAHRIFLDNKRTASL
jgi:hypothetical protein